MIIRSRFPRSPWDHGNVRAPRNLRPHARTERIFDSARVITYPRARAARSPRVWLLKFIEITRRAKRDLCIMREFIVKSVLLSCISLRSRSPCHALSPRGLNLAMVFAREQKERADEPQLRAGSLRSLDASRGRSAASLYRVIDSWRK